MPYEPIEEKRLYQRAEHIADCVWEIVARWDWFSKRTVGVQLVDAADSIGANVAEAGGRYHPGEVRNFLLYARGSLRETKFWLRRALKRGLVTDAEASEIDSELAAASQEINSSIRFQKTRVVREPSVDYYTTDADDPEA